MKVIFMGSPDFAVPSLKAIIESGHKVAAVFTQRPKPKGRGLKETKSAIHNLADQYNLPIYTPSSLRTIDVAEMVSGADADIIVVAAYGFIIPSNILYSKKYGSINLHPSRLPRFRGAAPLQHTIIEGDAESSICVIQMDEGLDTGDILLQKDFILPERSQVKWLHDYCAEEGAKLILEVLENIDSLKPIKQSTDNIKYAGKLSKEDGLIDWNLRALQLDAKIRGMSIWPGCYFKSNIGDIKIIDAEPLLLEYNEMPGKIIDPKNIIISCRSGALKINKLQLPGKSAMWAEEFINGYKSFELL